MSRIARVFRFLPAALAFAGASLVAGAPAACGSGDEGTTGRRVALDLRVGGSPGARAPFTNGLGWTVSLTKAVVATGPMTFYDGAPIFSWRAPRGLTLGGKRAFAHPGHYVEGQARGEVRVVASVDLRGEAVVVGKGEGISGMFRSATFAFGSPPSGPGPLAADLGGAVVVLEGTATKGSDARVFRARVAASDVANAKGLSAVEGCVFSEADVEGDGTVELTIKVETWLDQVDFTDVAASAGGAPSEIPASSIAHNALVRGMRAGSPYGFRFTPKGQ